MGDMEIIDSKGVRATFTDDGVKVDLVPSFECCIDCGDARLMSDGGYIKCYNCHNITYIDFRPHA